jgi:FKBP12-rapamycin complex-associated protein
MQVLNERAVAVMRRMSDKLMGRDYVLEGISLSHESDSVAAQVQRLIGQVQRLIGQVQAVSHENLCQSYIGWCPFW